MLCASVYFAGSLITSVCISSLDTSPKYSRESQGQLVDVLRFHAPPALIENSPVTSLVVWDVVLVNNQRFVQQRLCPHLGISMG